MLPLLFARGALTTQCKRHARCVMLRAKLPAEHSGSEPTLTRPSAGSLEGVELPAGNTQAADGARTAAAAIVPGSSAPAGLGLTPGSLPPGALAKLALGGRAGGKGLGTLGNPGPSQTPAGGAASPAPGSSMEAPPTPPSNGRKAEDRCERAALNPCSHLRLWVGYMRVPACVCSSGVPWWMGELALPFGCPAERACGGKPDLMHRLMH